MSVTTTGRITASKFPRRLKPRTEPTTLLIVEWVASVLVFGFLVIGLAKELPTVRPLMAQVVAWLAAVVVTDMLPVPLWGNLTMSLSFPILLAAGMLYTPHLAGAIAFVGSNDPREFRREISVPHGLYNRSQIALSTMSASALFHLVGGKLNVWPQVIGFALLAVATDMTINFSLVILARKLFRSQRAGEILRDCYGGEPVGFLSSYVCFGLVALLLAVVFKSAGGWGVIVFFIPVVLARRVFIQSRVLRDMAEAVGEKTRMLLAASERIAEERREERLTIAAGLHDEVLPPLYKAHLMGQVIRQDLARGQLLALEDDVPDLLRATTNANDAMRVLIRDLRYSTLGAGGLPGTLQLLVRHLREETASKIHLALETVGASPVVQLLTYQVTREAIKNAIRHAEAANIWVSVSWSDPDFRLVVSDDGRGFDPSTVDRDKHFGLQLMKERVELAGGVFHVSSQFGVGTQIVARLPAEPGKTTN